MQTHSSLRVVLASTLMVLPLTTAFAQTDNSVTVDELHDGAPRQVIQQVLVPGPERVIEVIKEVPIPTEPRVIVRDRIVEVPGPERIVEVEKIVYRDRPESLPSSGPGIAALMLAGGIAGAIRNTKKRG